MAWRGSRRISSSRSKFISRPESMLKGPSGRKHPRSWTRVVWRGKTQRRRIRLEASRPCSPPELLVFNRSVDISNGQPIPPIFNLLGMDSHQDEPRKEAVWEARWWVEDFVKPRWGRHWQMIRIECDLTLDELQQIGHLDQYAGWTACRRLVRVPVFNDEIALAMWKRLQENAQGIFVEEKKPNYKNDELDIWEYNHDADDDELTVGDKSNDDPTDDEAQIQRETRQRVIDYSNSLFNQMSQQLVAGLKKEEQPGATTFSNAHQGLSSQTSDDDDTASEMTGITSTSTSPLLVLGNYTPPTSPSEGSSASPVELTIITDDSGYASMGSPTSLTNTNSAATPSTPRLRKFSLHLRQVRGRLGIKKKVMNGESS